MSAYRAAWLGLASGPQHAGLLKNYLGQAPGVSKSNPPLCAAVHPVFALLPFGHVAAHPQIGTPTRAFRQLCMLTPSKGSASIERAHLCLGSREGEPPCRGTMPAAAFAEGRSPPAQRAVTDGEGGISSGRVRAGAGRIPARRGSAGNAGHCRTHYAGPLLTFEESAAEFERWISALQSFA